MLSVCVCYVCYIYIYSVYIHILYIYKQLYIGIISKFTDGGLSQPQSQSHTQESHPVAPTEGPGVYVDEEFIDKPSPVTTDKGIYIYMIVCVYMEDCL